MSALAHCPKCGASLTPPPRPLSKRQAELLGFVREFITQHNYAPSFEEIAAKFGYHSLATVHEHLKTLERKGHITRSFNETRAIALVEASV